MGASLSILGDTILGVKQVVGLLLAAKKLMELNWRLTISHENLSCSVYNSVLFILEKESRIRNFG